MKRTIVAGLPDSGKTTFIAALSHQLVAGQIATELQLQRLSDDEGHVHGLEQAWLSATPLGRTKSASETWVTFHLKDAQGNLADILVPDLRGELFAQPCATGRCQRSLWEALMECDGLLLFTNADKALDDVMVDDITAIADAFADESHGDGATVDVNDEDPPEDRGRSVARPFVADDMPEEPKLVELLQAINRSPNAQKRRRLALIVSAWDVVDRDSIPTAWLSLNRPMLDQYLSSNSELWDLRIFGVSAQGGSLPGNREELRALSLPSERVLIVGTDVKSNDLTALVAWVIGSSGDGR